MKPVELERMLRETGRWPELAELYEKMSSRAPDPARGGQLLEQAARLFEQKVGDPAKAENCRVRALKLDPTNRDAFRALAARYEQREEFRKLADLFSLQAAVSTEPITRSEYFFNLAKIEEEKLVRSLRALIEYRRAWNAYPGNSEALNAAKSLAARLGLNSLLVDLLYEQLKLDIQRKDAAGELLELATDLEESDPLAGELADRCRELALEADPDSEQARQAMEDQHKRKLKAGKGWKKVFKKELSEARRSPPQKARRAAYAALRMAVANGDEGRNEALEAAKEILRRSPGDEVALETARRMLSREDYVVLLWDQLGATKRRSRKLELCYELLPLVRAGDQDTKRYEALLERGLEIDRSALPCRILLKEFFEEKGDFASITRLLEEELSEIEDPSKKVHALMELAGLQEEKVLDIPAAAAYWEKVLDIDPANREAGDSLVRLMREQDDRQGLAKALDIVAGQVETPKEKLAALKEAASIKEELQEPELAFAAWCRAFREDPSDIECIQGMERSAEAARAFEELAAVYQEELNKVAVARSTAFALRAAELWMEKIQDKASAIACYQHVLLADPAKFAGARLKACDALEILHEEDGDYRSALEVLEKALEIPVQEKGLSLSDKRRLLVKVGRAKRRLGDLAGSDAALRSALDIDGQDKDALRELALTLEEAGDLPGLSGILDKLVSMSDGDDKTIALCMSARVKVNKTGDLFGGFDDIAEAMNISPGHPCIIESLKKFREKGGEAGGRAFELMAKIYEETKEWRKLADLLEEELGSADGVDKRLPLLSRIGDLQEKWLDQPEMAFITWCRALREAPQSESTYNALFRLAETVDQGFNEIVALCEEIADTEKDSSSAGLAALKAAEVYEKQLEKPEEAKGLYKKAFKLTGGMDDDLAEAALDSLERLASKAGDDRELARALAFRIQFNVGVADDLERALLLKRLGFLRAEKLADPEGAIGPLEESLLLNPEDVETSRFLTKVFEETGSFEKLAGLLEQSLEKTEEFESRKSLALKLFDVLSNRLDRNSEAAEVLARLLVEQPGDGDLVEALEQIQGDVESRLTAGKALAPHYRETGQWNKLAEALEAILDSDQGDRGEVFAELADIYQENLSRPDLAFLTACRWHADVPGDEQAKKRLEGLAAVTGSWEEAVRALEEEIEKAVDPVNAARTRLRVAGLHLERLERPDRAIDHLKAVLDDPNPDVVPIKVRAADMLADLYRSQSAWADLADILENRLGWLERRSDKAEALRELAEVYKDKLDDPERAFSAACRSVRQDPGSRATLAVAEELADSRGYLDEMAALYEDLAEEAEIPTLSASYYFRLGELLENKLKKKEKARAAYRNALEIRPDDLDALKNLEALAERAGDFEEAVDLLKRQAAILEEEAGIKVRLKLAKMLEQELGEVEGAYEQYKHVVRADPKCLEALEALESILEKKGAKPSARLGVMQLMLRALHESEHAPILKRMARIAMKDLDRPRDALKYLKRAKELSPDDGEIQDLFIETYEAMGDTKALVKLYGSQAMASVGEERVQWLRKAAALLEKGEGLDRDSAKRAWQAVLSAEPEDPTALQAMLNYHKEDEKWDLVVDVLKKLIPLQHDPNMARGLFLDLASVLAEKLGNLGDAVEAATKAMELVPLELDDLEKAEKVLVHCSAWPEYAELLANRAELVPTPEEAAEVHKTRGRLILNRLHNPAGAADAFRRALELVPGDEEARSAVQELYETTGEWESLADMVQAELLARPPRRRRNELLRELSDIYENRMDAREQALRVYFRAFREDPSDEEVQQELERIARDAGKLDAMVQIYKDTAEALGDRGLAAKMFVKMATILEKELDRADEAADSYRMVLALEPARTEAREALIRLLSRQGRFDELAGALRAQAEAEPDPNQRVQLLRQAAAVYEEKLSDSKEASSCLALAADADPRNKDVIEDLVRVLGDQERWDQAVSVLEKTAAAQVNQREAKALKLRIADLLDKKMGDFEGAISIYRDFLKESPNDNEVLDSLARIYTKTGKWEDLLEVFARRAGATQDAKKRAALYRQMASIADEEFGDAARAARYLKRALELEPDDPSSLASLEAALRRAEEWDELVEVLKKRRDMEDDPSTAAALCFDRGEALENKLFEIDDAAECYREALELDPAFTPASAALAGIYQSMKDWQSCLDVLELQVAQMDEGREAADLFLRMGKICQEQLDDSARAREHYQKALELDSSNTDAVVALKGLSMSLNDWPAYLSLLSREADLAVEPDRKAALYTEMGNIWYKQLKDSSQAIGYYESALNAVSGFPEAALPLGSIMFDQGRWDYAEELLSSVVARSYRGGEEAAPNELIYKLGFAAEKQGKEKIAFQRYKEAYELDAVHLPTLEGLARLAQKRREDELALKALKTILFHHRNQKEPSEILDIYCRLGELHIERGEEDQASRMFEKALVVDGNCIIALNRMAEILENRGDKGRSQAFRLRLKAAKRKKESQSEGGSKGGSK
ncbi:MAG: tetratricopeptide repeat protein [Deltaproteobacteria bacterium]|nr:tetratricopeptide repeat protein [Deltaproteobacteria bacterium]